MTFELLLKHLGDFAVVVAGTGILSKVAIDWKIERKTKAALGHTHGGGNGKTHYATMQELMKHAVECPGIMHKKIEEYNKTVTEKMDVNHKETMQTFTELKVAIAKIQTEQRLKR